MYRAEQLMIRPQRFLHFSRALEVEALDAVCLHLLTMLFLQI